MQWHVILLTVKGGFTLNRVKHIIKKMFYGITILIAFTYISIFIFSIPTGYKWEIKNGRIVYNYPVSMILKRSNSIFVSLLEFNIGENIKGKSLVELLYRASGKTALLLSASITIALIFGILKGIIDSNKGKKTNSSQKILTSILPISLPDVLIAAIMQGFAIWLNQKGIHIFKVAGSKTISHSFLPIIVLSILPAFYIARITALAVEDCFKKHYILAARGKGCSSHRILWNHVMRNAIRTIVEGLPNISSFIISNTLIVEYVFSYPGLTTALMNHITMRDARSSAIIIILIGFIYFALNGLFGLINMIIKRSYREEAV